MISPTNAALLLGPDARSPSSDKTPEKPFGSVLSSLSKATAQALKAAPNSEPETTVAAQTEDASLSEVEDGAGRPAESHAYGFGQLGMFGLVGPTSSRTTGTDGDAASGPEATNTAEAAPAAETDADGPAPLSSQGELNAQPTPATLPATLAGAQAELQSSSATGESIVTVSPLASSKADLRSPAALEFQNDPEAGFAEPSERPGYQPQASEASEVSVLLLPGDGGVEIVTASEALPASAKVRLAAAIEKLRSEFRITVRSTSHNGETLSPSAPPQPGVALS